VRVFTEIQTGETGIGYFYDPTSNSGCICALPTELDTMKQIWSRPDNVIIQNARTEEEKLGIPKKKGGKKSGAKASQANDSDA
jgi:hypothetical protein